MQRIFVHFMINPLIVIQETFSVVFAPVEAFQGLFRKIKKPLLKTKTLILTLLLPELNLRQIANCAIDWQ